MSYLLFGFFLTALWLCSYFAYLSTLQEMWLYGDFNDWNKFSHPFRKLEFGKWRIVVPKDGDGRCSVKHLSKLKLVMKGPSGEIFDRLDPWATYVLPPPEHEGYTYNHHFWNPPNEKVTNVTVQWRQTFIKTRFFTKSKA